MNRLFCIIPVLCLLFCIPGFSQEEAKSNDTIEIIIQPEQAGHVLYDSLQQSTIHHTFYPDSIYPDSFRVFLDMKAGWKQSGAEYKMDSIGKVITLIVKAVKSEDNPIGDSVKLSEVFFLGNDENGLDNWFEIVNISESPQVLKHAFIQTTNGKFMLPENLEVPEHSCVVIRDTTRNLLDAKKEQVILADSAGAVISQFSWDASIMNFPKDTLFSLEINDVFDDTDKVENWSIIMGEGRPAQLPVDYVTKLSQESIWDWLKYVLWGAAGLTLIIVIVLMFRKKRK
ncbi:MAG: hypothetical protein U9Q98_04135 [Bacteroidota bacterium]|nr:hypothetical protein [Bacteroidota bacterium]